MTAHHRPGSARNMARAVRVPTIAGAGHGGPATGVRAIAGTLAVLRDEGAPRSRGPAMLTCAQFTATVDLAAFKKFDDGYGWS